MDISSISKTGTPKSKMLYHENPEALHIGTLPSHRYFIPFGKSQNPFDSRSASEYMATVATPISLQARIILTAISPRFAINIFENILFSNYSKRKFCAYANFFINSYFSFSKIKRMLGSFNRASCFNNVIWNYGRTEFHIIKSCINR